MNATGKPEDDRIYINPMLSEAEGNEEAEEGCLSIPELRVNIFRSKRLRMQAQDVAGLAIDQTEDGYVTPHLATRNGSPQRHSDFRSDGVRGKDCSSRIAAGFGREV